MVGMQGKGIYPGRLQDKPIYIVGDEIGDRGRHAVRLLTSVANFTNPLVDVDINPNRDMSQRPLCWLPLVIVETIGQNKTHLPQSHTVKTQFASAALTSMFLTARKIKKNYAKLRWGAIDEMIMADELEKFMQQKSMSLSRSSEAHIALYCNAFNELSVWKEIEVQGAPPKAVRSFEEFAKHTIEKAPKWILKNSTGEHYRLKVCMVAPVITTKLTYVVNTGNKGNRGQIITYEYAPFTSMEKGAFERVLNISSSIGFEEAYSILGTLPTHFSTDLNHRDHPNMNGADDIDDEWRPGLLFDCGLRTSESFGNVAMISKRLSSALMEIPSVCEIISEPVNEDGTIVSPELFYGDKIAKPNGRKNLNYPSRAAATRFARIVKAELTNADHEGITPESYTEENEGSTEHGVMFVETWKDTRGSIMINLCSAPPHFYHNFVRCKTCNGEVEIHAPKDYASPECDCPHCETEGGISWG